MCTHSLVWMLKQLRSCWTDQKHVALHGTCGSRSFRFWWHVWLSKQVPKSLCFDPEVQMVLVPKLMLHCTDKHDHLSRLVYVLITPNRHILTAFDYIRRTINGLEQIKHCLQAENKVARQPGLWERQHRWYKVGRYYDLAGFKVGAAVKISNYDGPSSQHDSWTCFHGIH